MAREMQNSAVVFADICDSTSLYQKLGDAAARNVVNACLQTMIDIVPRYQGTLVKTIGDAAMCIFPTADTAVLAASEFQSIITTKRPGNFPATLHIGLHYGPILVEEGDIYGDTVNVAAYLAAVATSEQILTTEVTRQALAAELSSCVRPIFNTVLKGSSQESLVYQVLWRTDRIDLTDVNDQLHKLIPGDTGSLLVTLDEERVRIDQWRTGVVIGRGKDCDLVVADRYASRRHVTIKLMRTHFYLIDHSINGTYVSLESGEEVHVLRGELILDGAGEIMLGRSRVEVPGEVINFRRDRRSMYRI
jgi:adenylate cyclase